MPNFENLTRIPRKELSAQLGYFTRANGTFLKIIFQGFGLRSWFEFGLAVQFSLNAAVRPRFSKNSRPSRRDGQRWFWRRATAVWRQRPPCARNHHARGAACNVAWASCPCVPSRPPPRSSAWNNFCSTTLQEGRLRPCERFPRPAVYRAFGSTQTGQVASGIGSGGYGLKPSGASPMNGAVEQSSRQLSNLP